MMTVMKTFVAGEQMTPDKVAKAVDLGMNELMQLGMTINTSGKADLIAKVKETKGARALLIKTRRRKKYTSRCRMAS